MLGPQHVHVDADVGAKESPQVERRFPRRLQADEDHGFHDSDTASNF